MLVSKIFDESESLDLLFIFFQDNSVPLCEQSDPFNRYTVLKTQIVEQDFLEVFRAQTKILFKVVEVENLFDINK